MSRDIRSLQEPVFDFVSYYRFNGEVYGRKMDFWSQPTAHDYSIYCQLDYTQVREGVDYYQALTNFFRRLNQHEITIPYSGGIDSETLLTVALDLGLKVHALTIDLFGMNQYDIRMARSFHRLGECASHRVLSVSMDDVKKKWLWECLFDLEAVSYPNLAGYIASRIALSNSGIVVIAEDGPLHLVSIQNSLFWNENEMFYWPFKFHRKYEGRLVSPFWDAQVISSFLRYPAIRERFSTSPDSPVWDFDARFLGKEYFYNDPRFKNLRRRFSQHGWESKRGAAGFSKEMTIYQTSPKGFRRKGDHVFSRSALASSLNMMLLSKQVLCGDEFDSALTAPKGAAIDPSWFDFEYFIPMPAYSNSEPKVLSCESRRNGELVSDRFKAILSDK